MRIIYNQSQGGMQIPPCSLINKHMKDNIQDIIKDCIKKDRKAQFRFFELYSPWAYTICKRYVYHTDKTKEVLQDSFLRIFNNLQKYDSEVGELKSWMARIIINCALTTTKKEAFNNAFIPLADLQTEPLTEDTFFEFSPKEIMKFLDHMPIGYKTVFNLSVMDEYSHKEIAQQLNISEITSRSQLRKAKIWLQENISRNSIQINL